MERSVGGVSLVVVSWFIFTLSPVYANAEGDALSAFKTSCIDGGGDPNNVFQSWDSTLDNPCTWFHVTCNNDNRVTRVDLGNADLSCQLVPGLGQLNSLQYLELYQNKISGPIPDEVIGNLSSLVSLDLYNNKLTGHIPESLGNLSSLRFFRLNNNNLTGTIPTSLTAISSLSVVDLSNNNLSGVVPIDGSFAFFTPFSFAYNPDLCYPGIIPGTCLCYPEIGLGTC